MMPSAGVFGVAGTDHRVRVDQVMLGMADKLDLPEETVQYIVLILETGLLLLTWRQWGKILLSSPANCKNGMPN